MGNIRWTNNASGTLAAGIAPGDTSITLGGGQGALFPLLSGAQYAKCTIEDVGGNIEVVHMTSRAGDVLTVSRAQEGTVAQSFASGSRFELRVTAGALGEFVQRTDDTMSGTYDATGGVFTGGNWNAGEVVNSPIRGESGVTSNQLVVPPGGGAPTIGGSVIYTAANLTQAALNALAFPVGTIMMWYGSLGGIPAGFQVCDGTNGTPDLRDRFVFGAGASYAMGQTGGVAGQTTGPGGAHTPNILPTQLAISDIPAHSHRIWGQASGGAGDTESFQNTVSAIAGNANGTKGWVTTNGGGQALVENTGGGGSHSHNASAVPDHTHSVTILPPFMALYYIMKV